MARTIEPERRSGRAPERAAPLWPMRWGRAEDPTAAIADAGRVLSYGELVQRVTAARDRMRRLGADRGQAYVLDGEPDTVEWVVDLYAALSAGMPVVIPDRDWSDAQRRQCLAPFERSSGPRPSGAPEAGVWLFTSGTTAAPKPYFRSRSVIDRQLERVHAALPPAFLENPPTLLSLAPLDHGFGLLNGLFSIHSLGGTLVLAASGEAADVASSIRSACVEALYGWPHHFESLADPAPWGESSGSSLRWCVNSSFRLDPSVGRRFANASGCPVRQQYGTTETGPLCLDAEEPPVGVYGCVGRPLAGVDVRISDRGGRACAPGEQGELAVRVAGQRSPGAADDAAFWPTGDIGYRDEGGRVFVIGRSRPFTDERKVL